jgi:hypothetical protein
MKSTKTLFITALTLAALTAGAWAENPGSGAPAASAAAPAPAAPPTVVTAADVQALKDALASQQLQMATQQLQIQRLTEQLERQQAWQSQQSAAAAAAKIEAAPSQPAPQQLAELNTGVAVQNALQGSDQTTQDVKNVSPEWETPLSIHLKGVTITPGGFAAAEFVRRSRELGSDVITPFNNLTMPGASQSGLPEFFGTARQSRPTIFVGGKMKDVELSSYVSGDFLSSGTTSNNNQTNSYTFRLRQAWGQAKFNSGWKFLGGQAWSLVTENKAGIAPSDDTGRVNDARPMTIDGQYNVGFTFARQYGIRLTKDFANGLSLAFAVENAQGTLTTHGNADNYLLGEAGATNEMNAFNGTYTANPAPDLVAKLAYDQGHGHYEIFGLADRFTDRIFPCVEFTSTVCPTTGLIAASAVNAYNASKEGGGFGFNARWTLLDKRVVFGLHEFGGTGIGRYGAAGLSDISIHANGTLNLIRDYQGLGTLEYHGKKLDVYSYAGVEYAGRAYDFDPLLNAGAGGYVGYGAPEFKNSGCYTETTPGTGNTYTAGFNPGALANCTADTRVIMEGTLGFWYRFYNGPKGRFQFGTQYSYVTRHTWSGVAGPGTSTQPTGLDNMIFTSFRYYLP